MKVKVSEATGPVLDWMVEYIQRGCQEVPALRGYNYDVEWRNKRTAHYSTDWAQGGPIIERKKICVLAPIVRRVSKERFAFGIPYWRAMIQRDEDEEVTHGKGPASLIAAMRCFVTSELGDEVDVPEELL